MAYQVRVFDGYVLEASTAPDFSGVLRSSVTSSSTTASLTTESLDANTTYYLRVGSLLDESSNNYGTTLSTSTLSKPASGSAFEAVFRTSATVSWLPLH